MELLKVRFWRPAFLTCAEEEKGELWTRLDWSSDTFQPFWMNSPAFSRCWNWSGQCQRFPWRRWAGVQVSQHEKRLSEGTASHMGTVSPNLIRDLTLWGRTLEHRDMSRDNMTDVRGAHSAKENGHVAPSPAQPSANFPHPSAGSIPEDTPVSSTSELTQTWVHVAKTFILIFPIYALGYFEFSFSWLLIGLVIFFWWRRNTGGKHSRLSRAIAFFEQEERSIKQSLTTSDLPPWVRHSV